MALNNPQQFDPRFPRMTKTSSPPKLYRMNGCGVSMYGKRDVHAETGAYVSTWCVALLFVPVFCLRAYRVAKAPRRGWYFIGREPLSLFAKAWNILLILGIAGIIGGIQLHDYLLSPAHVAKVEMADAAKSAAAGHIDEAAEKYSNLAIAGADESDNATAALKSLLDNQCQTAPLSQCATTINSAMQVARHGPGIETSDVARTGMSLVNGRGDSDPKSALAILDTIRPLVRDTRPIDQKRLPLLQKWVASEPNNLDAVVLLASALVEQGQIEPARKLLMPIKAQLGNGDGAGILGRILADEGDFDGAYALLGPYVKTRLDSLHAAEQTAEETSKRLTEILVDDLKNHRAPEEWYTRYHAAGEDQKQEMVDQYLLDHMKNDPQFSAAQAELAKQQAVVPMALDLGEVMLARGQAQTDPAARKEQLESAMDVFLSVQGAAGESDQYRIALGQVYYWLGQHAKGKTLFDEYLKAKSRSSESLLEIGQTMRSLGSETDARALMEEAYAKATSNDERYSAAKARAAVFKDVDEQITWLNRADLNEPEAKALLALAEGQKAISVGQYDQAVAHYRDAIADYSAMGRSETTLNQTALAYSGIFHATGDRDSFNRAIDYFQQAVDLDPKDTVLMLNAGYTLLSGALTDIIGSQIDLRTLHSEGEINELPFLYKDVATRQVIVDRVKAHPGVARAMKYVQRLMVLSPKSSMAYGEAYAVYDFLRDDVQLRSLQQRVAAAGPDNAEELANLLDAIHGVKDSESIAAGTANLQHDREKVDALQSRGGISEAVALVNQASDMMGLDALGQQQDADQVVSLVQKANGLAPSIATASAMEEALFFRGAKQLEKSDPDFGRFWTKYRRSMDGIYLMAACAGEQGPFRKPVLANADVQSAIALIRKGWDAFPAGRSAEEWALVKNVDPAAADRAVAIIENTPRYVTERSLNAALHPCNAERAMEQYWLLQMENKPQEALAAVKKLTDAGIPMPVPMSKD